MSYSAIQKFRIENRLCFECAQPLPSESKILRCPGCAYAKTQKQQALVAKRTALGLCIVCGQVPHA